MEDSRLAYRIRTAESADADALRAAIGVTLAHPDGSGKRASYKGAAEKGDLLVLERFDRQEKEWHVEGFVELHLRVDNSLTIRDMGTAGAEPQVGVVRALLDHALGSNKPDVVQTKVRRDATAWLEIFRAVPGFYSEGEEYRRPHYWTILRWDQEHLREAQQAARGGGQRPAAPRPPRPPQPPDAPTSIPARVPGPRAFDGPRPNRGGPAGPRDGGRPFDPRPGGPRPAGPGGPRPGGPRPGGTRPGGGFGGPPPRGPNGPGGPRRGPGGPSRSN